MAQSAENFIEQIKLNTQNRQIKTFIQKNTNLNYIKTKLPILSIEAEIIK